MALIYKDRIKETTTTTGTGTLTLAGAVTGYRAFTEVGNGNTCRYTIVGRDTGEWEVGTGTYTASGTTLARTTVESSSNANSLVNFSAGTKDVFLSANAVDFGGSGSVTLVGAQASLSAPQSISNNSADAIIFDVEGYDTDNIIDLSSPNYSFVVPTGMAGYWAATLSMSWDTNATGIRKGIININGSNVGYQSSILSNATVCLQQVVVPPVYLADADTMWGIGFQNSGAARDLSALMTVWRVGD